MSTKNENKIIYNILNLFHLDNNVKKTKNIPFPINKLKSTISSYTLFLNQSKKYNKSNLIKKSNQQNNVFPNKKKYFHPKKSNEILQNNKEIKDIVNINNNKINNKNIIDSNKKYQVEQNFIDYFINSSNSVQKKRCSNSVQEHRKKIINDIYSKKHHHKEKEINCLKLSSNNTNSTSVNTNYTNNFNVTVSCKVLSMHDKCKSPISL